METNISVVAAKQPTREALPFSVRTRGGATFDPRSDFWSYRDGVNRVCINFAPITGLLSSEMQQSLKVVLLWYAENASPSHITHMHYQSCDLVKYLGDKQGAAIQGVVASIDLLNYKAALSAEKAWFLTDLSGFLKKWHRLGLPGVTEDVSLIQPSGFVPASRLEQAARQRGVQGPAATPINFSVPPPISVPTDDAVNM